jgi:hypothetical protein
MLIRLAIGSFLAFGRRGSMTAQQVITGPLTPPVNSILRLWKKSWKHNNINHISNRKKIEDHLGSLNERKR